MIPSDESGILRLFYVVYEREMTSSYWRWQCLQNSFSHPIVIVAETTEGEIVGHYALLPVSLWRNGQVEKGAAAILGMVDPDYQRQGMFQALIAAAEAQLDEYHIETVIGFPNEKALPVWTKYIGFKKLQGDLPIYWNVINGGAVVKDIIKVDFIAHLCGWFIWPLVTFLFKTRKIPGERLKIEKPSSDGLFRDKHTTYYENNRLADSRSGYFQGKLTTFDHRVDALWEKIRPNVRYAINRDSAYLNWRFMDSPKKYSVRAVGQGAEILGLIVTRTENKFNKRFGYIAELLFDPAHPEIGLQLLLYAKGDFRAEGIGMITALVLGPQGLSKVFYQAGFRCLPKIMMPHGMYFVVKDRTERRDDLALSERGNWFLSWSDHDVV